MSTRTKNIAIGSFITSVGKLADKRGGKNKACRIAPELVYMKGDTLWFSSKKIASSSIVKLNSLTAKIKSAT